MIEKKIEFDCNRRNFLGISVVAMGAFITSVIGISIGRYAIGQSLQVSSTIENKNWISVGFLENFQDGIPEQKNILVTTQDGWIKTKSEEIIWVLRQGESLVTYTAVCPHLGCKVQWKENQNHFFCPCHASYFSKNGQVEQGAAARGLDLLENRKNEKSNEIEINFKRFKPLLAEKTEQR